MSQLRYKLLLGKFPVIEVRKGLSGYDIWLDIGSKAFVQTSAPLGADIRVGDLLTFYTEVLAKQRKDS